jgi:hypothetical protein
MMSFIFLDKPAPNYQGNQPIMKLEKSLAKMLSNLQLTNVEDVYLEDGGK